MKKQLKNELFQYVNMIMKYKHQAAASGLVFVRFTINLLRA
jgi:hypothetical protein